ncbi:MAG: EamA family transporter [Thermodesulfobacteriota bacterium]|nr:EamA family transporter [Thermodesulfobacteriota bacterium]
MTSVYIIWGSTYLAIRFAIETIPPFLMAGTRFLIAGGILYLIRRFLGDEAPSRREWHSAIIIGFLLLVGGNGGVVWAQQRVVSGMTAILVGTAPLWIVLIDLLRPAGPRPSRWAIPGLVLGFIGISLLVGQGQIPGKGTNVDPVGAVVLILASLFWAVGSLYSRQASLPSSPLMWTATEMLAGGAGLFLLGILTGELPELNLSGLTFRSLAGFTYLIFFGSWVGLTSYTWLLRNAPTPLVSTYAYVNPVVAVLLGHSLAAEPLTFNTLIAAAMVVGSVALTTISQQGSFRQKINLPPLRSEKDGTQ